MIDTIETYNKIDNYAPGKHFLILQSLPIKDYNFLETDILKVYLNTKHKI
jgi:hypothetical protein